MSWGCIVVQAPGAVIENCEVFSIDPNGNTKSVLFDDPATGGVVCGCAIHDVEDGVYISTTDIVEEDNYIHDLKSTGFDPHYDGIQLHGGVSSDVTIRHNSVSEFPNINNWRA
jgi:nitrous oxidase accessory protein NosD